MDATQNDHQVTLWNPTIDYTGTTNLNAVSAFNIYGGTISGDSTGSIVSLGGSYAHTVQGVNFLDCANSCVYILGSSNKVIGNTFTNVGDGSGGDYSVRELLDGSNNNVVNENQTLAITGAAAATPYRVGSVSAGKCIASGLTPAATGSYCDGTRNTGP